MTNRTRYKLALIAVLSLWLMASEMDYQDAVDQAEYQDDMVEMGYWPEGWK